MKKTLLFSDVHLKAIPEDRARQAEFVSFLRGISPDEYDTIICLGDLFDFWYEYRSVIFSDFFNVLVPLPTSVIRAWNSIWFVVIMISGQGVFFTTIWGFTSTPT